MVESNGPDKRLREIELVVATMRTAAEERQKRIDNAFKHNDTEHSKIFQLLDHLNDHIDRMERHQIRATFILGIIVFLATVGSTVLIKVWLERAINGGG